jgi:hypothetical protein
MKFVSFYYVEELQHSSSLQDTELRVVRFVNLEALEADAKEPEDEVEDNADACAWSDCSIQDYTKATLA